MLFDTCNLAKEHLFYPEKISNIFKLKTNYRIYAAAFGYVSYLNEITGTDFLGVFVKTFGNKDSSDTVNKDIETLILKFEKEYNNDHKCLIKKDE